MRWRAWPPPRDGQHTETDNGGKWVSGCSFCVFPFSNRRVETHSFSCRVRGLILFLLLLCSRMVNKKEAASAKY